MSASISHVIAAVIAALQRVRVLSSLRSYRARSGDMPAASIRRTALHSAAAWRHAHKNTQKHTSSRARTRGRRSLASPAAAHTAFASHVALAANGRHRRRGRPP